MQFIENGADGGRTAILRLRSPEARCEITLLPLIEGAGRMYEEAILRELQRQDAILFDPGPVAGITRSGSIPRRMDLAIQRAVFRDSHERDGQLAPNEMSPQEFGSWWQGFPVGGGPHTSVALFRSVVLATSRGPRTVAGDLSADDEIRLRRLVLEPPDGSIEAIVDRLYDAMKRRAVFVAILLSHEHAEAVALRLRVHHRMKVVGKMWLPLAEISPRGERTASSSSTLNEIGRRLMNQLADRRHRAETLQAITRVIRLVLIIVTIMGAIGLSYFGIVHWSDLYPR